jgi:hypothetical protein
MASCQKADLFLNSNNKNFEKLFFAGEILGKSLEKKG